MDYSPTSSSVHGIFQTRKLEWVAFPFSRGSSWPRARTCISCTADRLFTIWATREAPYLAGDILISSFLQPFTDGPGRDVSCEHKQRYFSLMFRRGRQGPWRWAVIDTVSVVSLTPREKLGHTAGGERPASKRSFICIYSRSESLTRITAWALPLARSVAVLDSHMSTWIIPNPPPLPYPWKNCLPQNWSLMPKWLGTVAVSNIPFAINL